MRQKKELGCVVNKRVSTSLRCITLRFFLAIWRAKFRRELVIYEILNTAEQTQNALMTFKFGTLIVFGKQTHSRKTEGVKLEWNFKALPTNKIHTAFSVHTKFSWHLRKNFWICYFFRNIFSWHIYITCNFTRKNTLLKF